MKLNKSSTTPIYMQIINTIVDGIETGKLQKGDQIPSIQQLCSQFYLAPGTVTKAYEYLRSRGIIVAIKGKGYYVNSTATNKKRKILLLFDQLNPYKEILYNAFISAIGEEATVNVFFHHYNKQVFKALIDENLGQYSDYVIMPHFNEDVSKIIRQIPKAKLVLIDRRLDNLEEGLSAVYQNFKKDVYTALQSGAHLLERYKSLTLVLPEKKLHYVPGELIEGFNAFCQDFSVKGSIAETLTKSSIQARKAFIVFMDQDLINMIKFTQEKGLQIGQDVGLISYDDTPLKEVLLNGITVISTDFAKMGRTAAMMILEKRKEQIENPCQLIVRSTL